MRKLLIIVSTCVLCASCGVKSDPEYKSRDNNNIIIHLA